jgi:hypothetical protein
LFCAAGASLRRTDGHTCCCRTQRPIGAQPRYAAVFLRPVYAYRRPALRRKKRARRLAPAAEPTRLCAERSSSACCITRDDNGPDVQISLSHSEADFCCCLSPSCLCLGFVRAYFFCLWYSAEPSKDFARGEGMWRALNVAGTTHRDFLLRSVHFHTGH